MHRRELLKLSALLFGSGMSASLSRAVLAGAEVPTGLAASKFGEAERIAVEHLCDMIIPITDTPGALEAGVPDFVASIIFDWYSEAERTVFFDGLRALDSHCLANGTMPFFQASDAARESALREQERLAQSYKPPPALLQPPAEDAEAPFFSRLKALVVLGYYTSKIGATQELIYMPIPGEYRGDVDFSEMGRQWIT